MEGRKKEHGMPHWCTCPTQTASSSRVIGEARGPNTARLRGTSLPNHQPVPPSVLMFSPDPPAAPKCKPLDINLEHLQPWSQEPQDCFFTFGWSKRVRKS